MESELVSGFMTEHAAVIFVFFFLAEYASIVLMCLLISILFLGGYNFNFSIISSLAVLCYNIYEFIWEFIAPINTEENVNYSYMYDQIQNELIRFNVDTYIENLLSDPKIENIVYASILGIKTVIMIFVFIWVRASFPRIRFDQLMSYCWTVLLPLVFAFILLVPCVTYTFQIIPSNALF